MAGRWLGFSRINHQRCGWGTRVARIHRHIVTTLPHVSCRGRPRVRRWGERCGMVVFTFRLHSFISNHHPSPPLLCRACRCTVDWTDLIASRSPSEPSGAYRCCHVMSGAVHAAIYAVYDQVLSGHAAIYAVYDQVLSGHVLSGAVHAAIYAIHDRVLSGQVLSWGGTTCSITSGAVHAAIYAIYDQVLSCQVLSWGGTTCGITPHQVA